LRILACSAALEGGVLGPEDGGGVGVDVSAIARRGARDLVGSTSHLLCEESCGVVALEKR